MGDQIQFDTSGRIRKGVITPRGEFSFRPGFRRWSDLSPFVQGYVEAMFGQPIALGHGDRAHANWIKVGFSDLAPETLARIMEDCERAPDFECGPAIDADQIGNLFWRERQIDRLINFPPLTPYLGDDGKVRLSEAPSSSRGE